VLILEPLMAEYGFPPSKSTCAEWVSNNSLDHPVLRDRADDTSIATLLAMAADEVIVLDRQLKIVYRGSLESSVGKSQVLNVLSTLQ